MPILVIRYWLRQIASLAHIFTLGTSRIQLPWLAIAVEQLSYLTPAIYSSPTPLISIRFYSAE